MNYQNTASRTGAELQPQNHEHAGSHLSRTRREESIPGIAGGIGVTQLYSLSTHGVDASHSQTSSSLTPALSDRVNSSGLTIRASGSTPLVDTVLLTSQTTGQANGQRASATMGREPTTDNGDLDLANLEEWISPWLRRKSIFLLVLATLLLMGTIIGLSIWSSLAQGIASVDLNKQRELFDISEFTLGISLSWTVVPVLVLQIYILCVAALVKAASLRQPYVELRRPTMGSVGVPAEKSIFLDYQSYWAIEAPFRALRHKHYMLAYSFSIALVGSIILTALTSHLFTARITSVRRSLSINQNPYLDELSFGARSDLTPTIDIVAATRIYGGQPTNWITLKESLLPIPLDKIPINTNITFSTQSFGATLDCNVLNEPSEFELGPPGAEWKFKLDNRGCQLTQSFTNQVYRFVSDYIFTYTNESCGSDAVNSRFVVVAAVSANLSALDHGPDRNFPAHRNKTAISCIPEYSNKRGLLSASIIQGAVLISDYTTSDPGPIPGRPGFAYKFEVQLSESSVIDDTAQTDASNFGRLVYNYANTINPTSYFDGEVLRRATKELYSSAFAVMANQYLTQPVQHKATHVTLYEDATHLYVVLPVACTISAIFFLTLVMLIWVLLYSRDHPSIQYEESRGLLGSVAILRNNDLISRVQDIPANRFRGKVAKSFTEQSKQVQAKDGWAFVNWNNPALAAIKCTPRV